MPNMDAFYLGMLRNVLLAAGAKDSAIEDIIEFNLKVDLPSDFQSYIDALKMTIPHCFNLTEPTGPKDPERGSPEYDANFLQNLAQLAGPIGTSEAKPEGSNTGPTPPPTIKTIKRGQDDLFIENLRGLAEGTVTQI